MNSENQAAHQIPIRSVATGPVCVLTQQGRLYFDSAKCAENVLTALLLAQSVGLSRHSKKP